MSTINPYYTFEYSQPSEYRFSHDSVFLARQIFELFSAEKIKALRALDLCAGCGIIGLDFLFHAHKELGVTPRSMDFLEIQEIYQPHFTTNKNRLGPIDCEIRFLQENYLVLTDREFYQNYDLILCNPPYFFPEMGRPSPSDFKNRCRFFIDSDFPSLLSGIANALAPSGQAYILVRDLPQHGWDSQKEIKSLLDPSCEASLLGDIRGTHLVRITKTTSWPLPP